MARREKKRLRKTKRKTKKIKIVIVPCIHQPIQPCPGFAKKGLSDFKLDILALCGFGCPYCSSNNGNYLRIHRALFADLTEQQLGERILPGDDPELCFIWKDIISRLRTQVKSHPPSWGRGKTLVYSMLTDAFSPVVLKLGYTMQALRLVLEHTSFRIRVLTKNSIVGKKRWIKFFKQHPGRFVVGLSIGSLDNSWARRIELGTSTPTARLSALRKLQDAGVPTFGMLCPIFPDVMADGGVERLIEQIRPDVVEHIWAEPYNDRQNWEKVRAGYPVRSHGHQWFTHVYEDKRWDLWSGYATELYKRLLTMADADGWTSKLRYLLYEDKITEADARKFKGLRGVLLQSKPNEDGCSKNPYIGGTSV